MKLTILGAAGEVTGSSYLVETANSRVLIDCGIFQGEQADEKNVIPERMLPEKLDAVLLTHAHNDHIGRLPLLYKKACHAPVFANSATRDMAQFILLDAAKVQAQDIERENRKRQRRGEKQVEPLFDHDDVIRALSYFHALEYGVRKEVASGITARLVDAGHMLGSSSIELTVQEKGGSKVLVFSGDIGPRGAPFLRDPHPIPHADLVVLESTYGNRDHRPLADTLKEFKSIVLEAQRNKGVILVPVFAVGRAQQIIYHLTALFRNKEVTPFPIYLDSPMAIEAVSIYRKHTSLFDEEALALQKSGQLDQDFSRVTVSPTADDSRKLNELEGPMLIMAGSGMCNAGRILHHLKHRLWQADTYVVIVGYQSEGTLGRQLVDGKEHVTIHGDSVQVRAKICTLGGFSAHAGQTELLAWYDSLASSKPVTVLTHGEDRPRKALREKIEVSYRTKVLTPHLLEEVEL
ncbi:MAG TPA: MBL fold metallo-hydrolase [Gemmatales bacterium]|nr:MBL fold metallo-hydrolase [Gemmatales bacterium]